MATAATRLPSDKRGHPPLARRTARQDAWWVEPLITVVVLGAFIVYSTWVVFQGRDFYAEPYLSPFYSPLFQPAWWPLSPALFVMWAPLLFRLTCYYYRKAYYRAFLWDPPACAVGEVRGGGYGGETGLFVFQNLHRFALYFAVIVLAFLWYDTIHAFFFRNGFGIGLGSIILLANVLLLSGYTFGCHSFRYLIGCGMDCASCAHAGAPRLQLYRWVSALNGRHAVWAWTSLFSVALADLYVRLVASGVISDVRFL